MTQLLTLRHGAVGGFLLCLAFASTALTLGRSRGVALIGRPLDLAILATLDAGTDTSGMCVQAEVFQGDARIAEGRITARLESVSGSDAVLRVRTTIPIDEPIVTVYMRVGCGQAVTRRYVLLAEPAGDAPAATTPASVATPAAGTVRPAAAPRVATAEVAAVPPQASLPSQVPGPVVSAAPVVTEARELALARATVLAERRARRAADATAPERPARPAAGATGPRSPGAVKPSPRLKLDPIDLVAERDPTLRASQNIATVPEVTADQRSRATALWKALSAGPEDILRNTQRMEALEGDMKSLARQIQANNAALTDLRASLDKARDERYANGLVYTLFALLLLTLALLVLRWRAGSPQRWQPEWWRGREAGGDTALEAEPELESPVRKKPEVDLDLDVAGEAPAPAPVLPPREDVQEARAQLNAWARSGSTDFQHSQPASMRSVKAEELNDVQQQADFFISLGEHEQAISVLISHIHAHPQTSAMAWLDLLDLHHRLQRREGYEALREQWQQRFNVQVPPFDGYRNQTSGLEAYVDAMSRICALWPSARVLDVIEDSIFRKPGVNGGEPFDLAAYRELLLLYNIGKEVIEEENGLDQWDSSIDSATPQPEFSATSILPLSVSIPYPAWRVRDIEPAPDGADSQAQSLDSGFGIDIDLDVLGDIDAGDARESANEPSASPPAAQNLIDFDAFDDATSRLPRRNP